MKTVRCKLKGYIIIPVDETSIGHGDPRDVDVLEKAMEKLHELLPLPEGRDCKWTQRVGKIVSMRNVEVELRSIIVQV